MPCQFTSPMSILILFCHMRLDLPSGLLPSGFATKKTVYAPLRHKCYMPCPSQSSLFDHPNNISWGVQSMKLFVMWSSPLPCYLVPLGPNILLSTLFSKNLSLRFSLNVSDQVSHPGKTIGKIIVLCIVILTVLDSKLEDKRFCTEWWQAFPDLICTWIFVLRI
jgi:hypothetical protein